MRFQSQLYTVMLVDADVAGTDNQVANQVSFRFQAMRWEEVMLMRCCFESSVDLPLVGQRSQCWC